MRSQPPLVVLTGPIASGKSTIGRLAVVGTPLTFFPEDVDSRVEDRDVLARYYAAVAAYESIRAGDPEAASRTAEVQEAVRATQEHFITTRTRLLRGALSHGRGAIAERHPRDDIEIFSRRNLAGGLLTQQQFDALERLLERELAGIPAPALHVFLHAETARLRERIRRRGRPQEVDLIRPDNPYLEELNALYEDWYRRCAGPKVLIRTDALEEASIATQVRESIQNAGI